MPALVRVGDTGQHGFLGTVTTGSATRTSNGRPVARIGDIYTCNKHGDRPIVPGPGMPAPTAFDEGKQVARIGDMATCGAIITTSTGDTSEFSDA